ncbi:MAG: pilus assembly protein TadG-related protein, partial [Bryobacteraceae bacterium]
MRIQSLRKKGQIIIMYTVALFAMAGIIGLAVDGGWAFYVKKHAQMAADGAAMAAAKEALRRVTRTGIVFGSISCTGSGVNSLYCTGGSRVVCGSSITGSPSNLYSACQYAVSNGFEPGGQGGKQNVTIESGLGVPPTGEGLSAGNVYYWVTVRTTQSVPQLFSSLLGNTQGLVAARSTAAVVTASAPISIYGLNREGDCTDHEPRECGIDIEFEVAGGSITANGGMVLDSNCTGKYVAGQCVSLKGPG